MDFKNRVPGFFERGRFKTSKNPKSSLSWKNADFLHFGALNCSTNISTLFLVFATHYLIMRLGIKIIFQNFHVSFWTHWWTRKTECFFISFLIEVFAFLQFSLLIHQWSVVFVFVNEPDLSLQCKYYGWYREKSSPWIPWLL